MIFEAPPVLTILIITYNHCDSIIRTLDSVFSQITDYSYEVVIHDDASTDGTTSVLLDYKKNYPQIIKLLCEEENVYSKGPENIIFVTMPHIKGKYVITLEGDDYWCDERKIQKQIDYMERNPAVIATTHRCMNMKIDTDGDTKILGFSPSNKDDDYWSIDEVIDWADGPHTTSLLMKSELYKSIPTNLHSIAAGDWKNMVWLCANGRVHYSDDIMSAHVLSVKGSYTERNFGNGVYHEYEHLMEKRQKWCDMLDNETSFRYHKLFVRSQERRWGQYYWNKGEYRRASKFKSFYKGKSIRKKIVMMLISLIPGAEEGYRRFIS